MKPPLVPRAIVTAIAAPDDYESVIGDLQEEYGERFYRNGRGPANGWYWSQALRSIPSLLSYSRSERSLGSSVRNVAIATVTVLAMMVCYDRSRELISNVYTCSDGASDLCAWPFFVCGWVIASIFGAILSALVRAPGIRLTLFASLGLVASIVIPTALGFSSRLPLLAWLLLCGVIPAMSAGSAMYQLARRR